MTKKQDTSKYIGLIHELQTHKSPFVIRPILERFGVPRYASKALERAGYITVTGKTRNHLCRWVGTTNPTPGQLKLMAVTTMRETQGVMRDYRKGKMVVKPAPSTHTVIPEGAYKAPLKVGKTPGPVTHPPRPAKRISILWGLFAFESK